MVDEAALLAISTIRGVHNFFSRLRNLKDERGEPVFNTVDFKLECRRPECKDKAEQCPHVLADLPAHLSANKAQRVKMLMSGEDNLYMQEIQNIESDPTEPMFYRKDIEWLFDRNNEYVQLGSHQCDELIVTVDPNSGGLSNYAITSFVKVNGLTVVRRGAARR